VSEGAAPASPLLAALMARTGGVPLLPANSRYHGVPMRTLTAPDGTVTAYLARRFVPPPASLAEVDGHTMAAGERLDLVAARRLGDPLLAWRIADANGALDPAELERPGRRLRLTLPEGVPGGPAGPRDA
jgi:hypothetical protein